MQTLRELEVKQEAALASQYVIDKLLILCDVIAPLPVYDVVNIERRRRMLSASVTRSALTGTTSLDKGQQSNRECRHTTEYPQLKKLSLNTVDNSHMYSIARNVIPAVVIIPEMKLFSQIARTL